MKIVVLAGGISTEREVSLVTGTSVCRALRGNGHRAILVDLFLGLEQVPADLETLFDAADGLCPSAEIRTTAPDLDAVRRQRKDQGPSHIGPHVLDICAASDMVFLGLHGQDGEDGRIQATLDLLGIPYTGAGYLASGMAMDKAVAKRMMDAAGIPTPKWQLLRYGPGDVETLAEELPMPCVVKTTGGGSSLGVYLPEDRAALKTALMEVLRYGGEVLAEERIFGRDLTVGVLGDRWLPAVEIVPAVKEFDYTAKYQAGGAQEICPAPITEDQQREMGELALKLHRTLGLAAYSRTDFILDEAGRPWCLEVNSLPGLTAASLVPKEAAAVGMTYPQLCEEIVRLSREARGK
jgi:D-alanine-D-alanine ligase